MATLNTETHVAKRPKHYMPDAAAQLERIILTCFLWENSFYEKGSDTAARIAALVPLINPDELVNLILKAREDMNIRHAPLFVINEMVKIPGRRMLVKDLIQRVVKRPDDATELLAMYWKDGKKALPSSYKKGLGLALQKFSGYQLAKYQSKGSLKLVDLFNLVHPFPKSDEQAKLWKEFMKNGLPPANTWETRLSGGEDPLKMWTSMLKEKELGALALLRNLRNMLKAGVNETLIRDGIMGMDASKVLPFRFIAAAKHAPALEGTIEAKMLSDTIQWGSLSGKTTLLIDVSGSMDQEISSKSDLTRMDAACALAMLIREICESVEIYSFSERIVRIPDRRGFSLRDAIVNSQPHSSTHLGKAMEVLNATNLRAEKISERLIVFTDEQANDTSVPNPNFLKPYMINVAGYEKTWGNERQWMRVNGFSEKLVDFMMMSEKL